MTASLDLPPTSVRAPLIIAPDLLSGLGITKPRIPDWVTDPNLIADILAGHADIPTDLMGDAS